MGFHAAKEKANLLPPCPGRAGSLFRFFEGLAQTKRRVSVRQKLLPALPRPKPRRILPALWGVLRNTQRPGGFSNGIAPPPAMERSFWQRPGKRAPFLSLPLGIPQHRPQSLRHPPLACQSLQNFRRRGLPLCFAGSGPALPHGSGTHAAFLLFPASIASTLSVVAASVTKLRKRCKGTFHPASLPFGSRSRRPRFPQPFCRVS